MLSHSYIYQVDEVEEFFDSREEISSFSDSCPGSPSRSTAADKSLLKVWTSSPDSVRERRARFMRCVGLDTLHELVDPDVGRVTSDGGAVLRSSGLEDSYSDSACSTGHPCTSDDSPSRESFEFKIKNSGGDGSKFVVEQYSRDGTPRDLCEVGSSRSSTQDEFGRNSCPSSFAQKLKQREERKARNVNKVGRSRKLGWLRRLGAVACLVDRQGEEIHLSASASDKSISLGSRRVKVHRCKKQSKELSAVYKEQDINAHDGAILTMKFSPDGEFLASGGEDGVVRVWRVIECERRDEGDTLEYDPSCIYFTVNHNSELAPLYAADKEKFKSRSMWRTPDSACIVVPPEVFRISEKPLHEFHGHNGDVLDLSWSEDKYLLSSSTDKTVRLWRSGLRQLPERFCA
ncbi:WD repeat-containing protein 44-like [Iris pallida]|uniref:WD repeat-containing protein 44-like n=1 Tax=Iris pallida TaxID=29817 RepID=A0AAX6EH61_IRIPA|nr:WD repeat-containing protein 44-like [Iris pallida]